VIAPGVDVGHGGLQEPDRVVGPGDLAEAHDVLAVGALGVLARAAGDPGLEDPGDREEELSHPLLDPARGGAGENRRQVADESLGEDDQLARGFDRSLDFPLSCMHAPVKLAGKWHRFFEG
jgi:hypothetical protein